MGRVVQTADGPMLVDDEFEFASAVAEPEVEVTEDPSEGAPSTRTRLHKPEDVPHDEWERRSNAVRTMAREFDAVDHGDIREFLTGKTTRELNDEEIGQIQHDVLAQRVTDITDVLDEQLRSTTERMKRARRTVRVQAPRGWLQRAFGTLDERAVGQVAARLIQRGHDPEVIKEKVVGRVKDEDTRRSLEEAIDNDKLSIEFSSGVESGDLMERLWAKNPDPSPEQILDFVSELMEMYRNGRGE